MAGAGGGGRFVLKIENGGPCPRKVSGDALAFPRTVRQPPAHMSHPRAANAVRSLTQMVRML